MPMYSTSKARMKKRRNTTDLWRRFKAWRSFYSWSSAMASHQKAFWDSSIETSTSDHKPYCCILRSTQRATLFQVLEALSRMQSKKGRRRMKSATIAAKANRWKSQSLTNPPFFRRMMTKVIWETPWSRMKADSVSRLRNYWSRNLLKRWKKTRLNTDLQCLSKMTWTGK